LHVGFSHQHVKNQHASLWFPRFALAPGAEEFWYFSGINGLQFAEFFVNIKPPNYYFL